MKATRFILAAALSLVAVAASAQQTNSSAYFLENYTFRYKLNPAFSGSRGFVSLPAVGRTSASFSSNLGINDLFATGADGALVSVFNPAVSTEQILANMKAKNPVALDVETQILGVGFRTGMLYHTIDMSLKANTNAVLPKDLFRFLKDGQSERTDYDLGSLALGANVYGELAYGITADIDNLHIGGRVKGLIGLLNIKGEYSKLDVSYNGSDYIVESSGSAQVALPGGVAIRTKAENGESTSPDDANIINSLEIPERLLDMLGKPSFGGAIDLGVSIDFLDDYLTLSAAVLDLGFMKWNNISDLSSNGSWRFDGFDDAQESNSLQEDASMLKGHFEGLMKGGELVERDLSQTRLMPCTVNAGFEARLPRTPLSVGILGTGRFDGIATSADCRVSLNMNLAKTLGLSTSYSYGTYGSSCGAAFNLHLPFMNLFAGVDNWLGATYPTIDGMLAGKLASLRMNFGLDITFGKYYGRK